MTAKIYDVSVLLDVHKVNCPGVWLCPKGKVSIKVCLFGVSDFTKEVDPNFPLIFNERFHFQRKFRKSNTLPELQKELGASLLTMQLYQFPTETAQSVKLAVFNSPLQHVLSPDIDMPRNKPSEVDLLFYPCKVFPGIIAPKAEVVAKLAVVENVEPAKVKVNTTVSSFPPEKRFREDQKIIRQQPVCHTKNYFRCKCFKDWYNSESQGFNGPSNRHTQGARPRSARRTGRPKRKNRRRFKSCSTAYCEESSSESSNEESFLQLGARGEDDGNKCISNVIGAHCRCACARETRNIGRRPSPPHSSEYSSSDYTDVNASEEPLGQTKAPLGCQCFRKTWRENFEEEMTKRKHGPGLKTTSGDVYHQERYRPHEESKSNGRTYHPGQSDESKRGRPYDETHRHNSIVLEKSSVDGRKWGVKAFNYHQPTSVR